MDGKCHVINTNIKWSGIPPSSLRALGDTAFEKSRARAESELQRIVDETQNKGRAEHLTERLIHSKTGRQVQYVRIDELPDRWRNLPRKSKPTEAHFKNCDAHFKRFTAFMQTRSEVIYLYEVGEQDAHAFSSQLHQDLAPATARYGEKILGSAFSRFLPVGSGNPFAAYIGKGLKAAPVDRIHRVPFTPAQLGDVYEAARMHDPELYPVIVAAACTGLRRGDVCRLRWEYVDLKKGLICIMTSKTGKKVWIPIFAPLRAVLDSIPRSNTGYVFPFAANLIEVADYKLSTRLKKVIALALSPDTVDALEQCKRLPSVDIRAIAAEGRNAIMKSLGPGKRRDAILDTFERYASGQSLCAIARNTGKGKSTVSERLHAAENLIGKKFVPERPGTSNTGNMKDAITRLTRAPRAAGMNKASLYDWHAFRTTWITLALAAGIPIETVRKVTGHATVDVVQEYYFQPDQKHFIAAFANTGLPLALTGGTQSIKLANEEPLDELSDLLAKIKSGAATEPEKSRFKELATGV